jgi:hypothetical protein
MPKHNAFDAFSWFKQSARAVPVRPAHALLGAVAPVAVGGGVAGAAFVVAGDVDVD